MAAYLENFWCIFIAVVGFVGVVSVVVMVVEEKRSRPLIRSKFVSCFRSACSSPRPPSDPDSMVRLITHNLLGCHVKNCNADNFPLKFQNVQLELREAEFNPDFIRGFMPKIEWRALVDTAREVCDITLSLILSSHY